LIIGIGGTILESLSSILVLSNVAQFEKIINYFYHFKIFDYMSSGIFIIMFIGGFLIDIVFYLLISLFGYYLLYKKYPYRLKLRTVLLYLILALLSGITLLSFGFYYALPGILVPLEKLSEPKFQHEYEHKGRMYHTHHKINPQCQKYEYTSPNGSVYFSGYSCSNTKANLSNEDIVNINNQINQMYQQQKEMEDRIKREFDNNFFRLGW